MFCDIDKDLHHSIFLSYPLNEPKIITTFPATSLQQ